MDIRLKKRIEELEIINRKMNEHNMALETAYRALEERYKKLQKELTVLKVKEFKK